MRRIAFIGIEHADSEVLHSALRRNLGNDAEINAFNKDVNAVNVASFLVAKNKEGQLDGKNSVAYISGEVEEEVAKRIGRLRKAGVTIRTGWEDFKPEAEEDEIGHWLTHGTWPEPEPEPEEEEDDDADLLALLAGYGDDDDEDDEPATVAAPSAPEPQVAVQHEEDTTAEEDDVPAFVAPVEKGEEEEYPTRRFDSMGANDGAVASRRLQREAESRSAVAVEELEDDDLPMPSFYGGASPVAEAVPAQAPVPDFVSDDADDELPDFGGSFSASDARGLDDDDDDLELPTWGGAETSVPERKTPAPVQQSQPAEPSFDEEDELPDFAPAAPVAPQSRRAARRAEPVQEPQFSVEEDELPDFGTPFQSAAPQSRRAARVAEPEPVVQPEPDFGFGDDEEDELPDFGGFGEAETPSRPAQRERQPEPSFQSGFDDEEDELPDFGGFNAPEPVQERREPAPSYARPDDEEDELPDFGGFGEAETPSRPAQRQPEPSFQSGFDDEEDELPDFGGFGEPEQEEAPEPEPAPRSRRDFLRQAESLAREHAATDVDDNESDDDEDGDSLPDFAPEFAPLAPVDEEDDLPSFSRRAVVDDDGDDLPEFEDRGAPSSRSSSKASENEDDEIEDSFAFAPKVQTPSYAAPAEKMPDWGTPVQRPEPKFEPEQEPVTRRREPAPEPVRKERRVAPEEVRYEADVPSEVYAREAARRREAEGYSQPVIETDVQNRRLKPAPDASAEQRKASQRVVNPRPAQPIVEDDLIEYAPSDDLDDFNPDATPPYMEQLEPVQRRAQTTMEQIRREYDSESVLKVRGKGGAKVFYVTGSHGGAGKTTSTWMMANTVSAALKKDPERPVFLIEGDYENSKLAQRLNLPPEKNSGRLAELYRKIGSDRSLITKQKMNMFEITEKIIKESIYVNEAGVNIIAAPYDLTKRDGRFLRMAIQKSVEYAERQGGYVFIDADTLSNDDILDRTLAAKATHVVLVSFGDQDHVDDTNRAIHTLTTPNVKAVSNSQSTNGMGVPKERIKLFFNKTGSERFEDLQRVMRPYLVEGHLPTVQGLNEGGWIGNLTGGDFSNAVTSYAAFVNRISPMPELLPYEQRRPQRETQRSAFRKMFGSRRG